MNPQRHHAPTNKTLMHKHLSLQNSTPTYSRQLLRMNVIAFETCWAIKTFIKWHQVGSIYSSSKMMHGPINIRFIVSVSLLKLKSVFFLVLITSHYTFITTTTLNWIRIISVTYLNFVQRFVSLHRILETAVSIFNLQTRHPNLVLFTKFLRSCVCMLPTLPCCSKCTPHTNGHS